MKPYQTLANIVGGITLALAANTARADPPAAEGSIENTPAPAQQPEEPSITDGMKFKGSETTQPAPERPGSRPSGGSANSTYSTQNQSTDMPLWAQMAGMLDSEGASLFTKVHVGGKPSDPLYFGFDLNGVYDVRNAKAHGSLQALVETLFKIDNGDVHVGPTGGWLYHDDGHHAKLATADAQAGIGAVARDNLGNYVRALVGLETNDQPALLKVDGQGVAKFDNNWYGFASGNIGVLLKDDPQAAGQFQIGGVYRADADNAIALSGGLKFFGDFMDGNKPIFGAGLLGALEFKDANNMTLTAGVDFHSNGPFNSSGGRDAGVAGYLMLTIPIGGNKDGGQRQAYIVPFRREYFRPKEDAQGGGAGGGGAPPDIPPFGG